MIISIALAFSTFLAMYLLSQYVFEFLVSLGVNPSQINLDGGYVILAILSTVILAPIGEELVYRYIICDAFESKGKWQAVIFSSLAFAFMHMSPMHTVYQFALGVVLALVVVKTRNVVCAMITHATSNALALLFYFIPLPQISLYNPLTIILAILTFALGGLLVSVLIKNINEKQIEIKQIHTNKQENLTAKIAYIIGFVVCAIIWISNFF